MRHRVFELLLILKATRLSSIGAQMLLWTMLGILSTLGIMTGITYNLLKDQTVDEIQKTLRIEVQGLESDLKQVEEFADGFGVAVYEVSRLGQDEAAIAQSCEQIILEFLKNRPPLVAGLGLQQEPFALLKSREQFDPYYSIVPQRLVNRVSELGRSQPTPTSPRSTVSEPKTAFSEPSMIHKRLAPPYVLIRDGIPPSTPSPTATPSTPDRLAQLDRAESLTERLTPSEARLVSPKEASAAEPRWLKPYRWNQQVLVTLLSPVRSRDRHKVGSTVVDIDITNLSERLARPVLGQDGYFVLLSYEGELLAYPPDPQRATGLSSYQKIPSLERIWPKIRQSRLGFRTTPAEFLAYRPIAGTDWMMVAVVPRRRLFAPIFQTALGTSLVASLVLLGSIWFFVHRLNQRLKPMINGCRELVHSSQMALLSSGITNEEQTSPPAGGIPSNPKGPESARSPEPIASMATLASAAPPFPGAGSDEVGAIDPSAALATKSATAIDPTLGLDEIDILQDAFQAMYRQLETSLSSLQNTLNQLKDTQLQVIQSEKMAAVGQMLAGVAHEINNPISFISGNVEHLGHYVQDLGRIIRSYQHYFPEVPEELQEVLEEVDPDFLLDDLTQMVRSMRLGSERVRDIVRSLRSFSRANDNDFQVTNIHEGLDSTLIILNHRIKASSERPEIQVLREYADLPLVECCLGPLNQVFMNLLSNAIDAIEESQLGWTFDEIRENPGIIRIQTRLCEGRLIRITIADNGSGIPEHLQGQVFNSFVTSKPVGKGTGLGLSISHQVIHQTHRGRLWFDSQVGRGTAFHIEIPIHQDIPSPALSQAVAAVS
ncbi:MAG: hypothetical protein BJG00_017545 [Limnothrix sp. CACIAM 69d]|nr:MAG: hypothetical protein BJG00_017545 [Limnothrix sp. CACIAM 69d]